MRSTGLNTVTIVMLLLGLWAIVRSNVLKEALVYVDQCQFVLGDRCASKTNILSFYRISY